MFDFLQKLSHQHPQKAQQKLQQQQKIINPVIQKNNQKAIHQQKLQQNIQKPKQPVKTQITKPKQLSLSAQLQMGQTAQLDPQVLRILEQIRYESEKRMLHQQKNKVQRKVYLREMSHNFQQYLQQVLAQSSSPNRFVRFGIASTIDHVANSIYDDILYTEKYQVTKKVSMTKDDIALLQNSLTHIKNNQGNIRNKVGQLKLQLKNESQKIDNHTIQIVSKHSFSINHPKTKQVQMFLKSLQMERGQQRMKYEEDLKRRKQKQIEHEYMIEIAREKAKSQRHQKLVQAYQINRKKKQEEFQQLARKNQQFQQWVKHYRNRVPLYRQKQKEFAQSFLAKQDQERYNKLLKRKQIYHPMQFQEFEEHQQRYLDYKKQIALKRKAQLRMQKQAQKRRKQQLESLHKGQFRYHVLQQMVAKKQAKDPKQDIIKMKLKQLAYSQNVKSLHKPTIDPTKKFQMELLNSASNKRNKYRNPRRIQSSSALEDGSYHRSHGYGQYQEQRDPKKDGQRNRRYFKQYIRQKIEKGQIKQKEQERPVTLTPKPNYLSQMRSARQSRIRGAETIDYEIQSIKKKQDISALIAQVNHHDLKAQRLQTKFKHAAHKPQQEAALEDNYLFSIKAKLELLKNYD